MAAGRRYVEADVAFMHYVEELGALAHAGGEHVPAVGPFEVDPLPTFQPSCRRGYNRA